jgi:hypothetical protein
MAKVAEPRILTKLQAELLEPATLAYITEEVKAGLAAQAAEGDGEEALRKQLADERRKRDNLVAAVEEGGDNLAVLMTALKAREVNIRRLEGDVARPETAPPPIDLEDLPGWVERRLQDVHALLKERPERVKAEFRRLNLQLRFIPVDYETDNPPRGAAHPPPFRRPTMVQEPTPWGVVVPCALFSAIRRLLGRS